ncbi:cellulase family glycosylhydrolase [Flavobacterium sp. LMO8]|uniref:cellulase family glycosylhydrolase n=1 Tax=Flavobacterium sp. LMO8 TaxID=2654244 RepID=UPI0012920F05|nr:cellulase family glycosylhydrolase [Flavobacterium sp. LMO8]MQP25667.1 cellulase family glycosylhydrolase [Flavobacterium sp. LMO8]
MIKKLTLLFFISYSALSQVTNILEYNTLIKPNHNIGLTNPLWNQNCLMTYNSSLIDNDGAVFTFNFINPGGSGFKGYPSGTIGGFKSNGTYSQGNLSASGMPLQIQNLQHNLRLKWKVFQQNGNDLDDKWWATINVIFDSTSPTQEPIEEDRDFDLVIQLLSYEQDTFTDRPNLNNGQYWYFARNLDNSLKTFDLYLDGILYQWAVRYKFYDYPIGDPDYHKNDKVHIKFIPMDNSNPIPNLDHSLKIFIDKGLELKPNSLNPQESILFDTKVAQSDLWIKSIAAGFEVYTGEFVIGNTYFYSVLDSTPPNAPLNLSASAYGTQINLNWDDVIDDAFESYLVYRSVNNGPFELLSDEVRVSNYSDTAIQVSNNYSYIIKAQDRSFNISNSSNQVDINYITSALTSHQIVANMGTGINLGNILSAPYEGDWASPLTEEYIDNVARLKFKHVRIPIRFDNQTTPLSSVTYTDGLGNYIGSPVNYTVSTTYLDRIEQIVDWCIARNLIAIIDVHGDHWFWESFDSSSSYYATGNDRLARIDRFKAIWRDISNRLQTKPDSVLFEIMNEPFFSMSASQVIDINTQIVSLIRSTNPTRCVIVTGGGQNSFEAPLQLSDAFIQSDNYLIATFHYYRPRAFTSSGSQNETDNDWGTLADQTQIQNEFDQVYNWSVQKNIPIFLGEFGADNVNGFDYFDQTVGLYGGPDEFSRRFFHQFVANYARSKGFAFAVWDAGEKAGKTVYLTSTSSWVKDVRNAVLGSACTSSEFIENANVECNYDYNWTLATNSSSVAKINNAYTVDSYLNSNTIQIDVTTSGSAFNDVILSNELVSSGFLINNNYEVTCFAKADNNQEFRFRIKCTVNGSATFITSPAFQLSSNYAPYNFSFVIPTNTTEVQFQIICGKYVGSYFFDEFSMSNSTLSNSEFISDKNFVIYPNPSNNYFRIQSNDSIDSVELYALDGRKINVINQDNSYFTNHLNKGVYIVKIISNSKTYFKKLIHE